MTISKLNKQQTKAIKNLDDLSMLAKELAKSIKLPALILLTGDLGTGKTAFTKKFLAEFGLSEDSIKSPTFSLVNQYHSSEINFAHLDLYRLDQHDVFLLQEIKEMAGEKNSAIIIEWPEKMDLSSIYPLFRQILSITIEFDQKNFRKFHICDKKI